jgi:hypothetical protein
MTFNNPFTRKSRKLVQVEKLIEPQATVILTDGRMGTIDTIRDAYGDGVQRAYVVGETFAAWVTEVEISIYKNAQYALAA